jgi:sec-independent protein translocase protein TatB
VFDISFAELMMIAVVALLVIGPDKLPQVARTVGAFVGRLQRYAAQVKEEVNREVRFEELQNLQQEIKQGAGQVEASIMDGAHEVQQTVMSEEQDVKPKRKPRKPKVAKTATKKRSTAKSAANKVTPPKTGARKKAAVNPAAKKTPAKQSKGQA